MKQPNILLLVSDHHRGDWMPYPEDVRQSMGWDKLPLSMPNTQRLMEQGTSFTRCITPSPLCAPARACLASGLNYEHCGVIDNGQNYPLHQRTFYSALQEAGYAVGGVGKFDLHKPRLEWGLNGWVDELGTMGFTHAIDNEGKWDGYNAGQVQPTGPYYQYLHDQGYIHQHVADFSRRRINAHDTEPTTLPDEAYCDNWLTRNGIHLIETFPQGKPWFLQVNFTGPHAPWDITQSMKDRWKDIDFPQPRNSSDLPADKHNAIRQNFAAMLENIDRNIGLLMDAVDSRCDLENTIIIYSADHGDMLGDHNLFGKCVPYHGSVAIPLVIWGMTAHQGACSPMLVELQDLAATIVDLAQTQMPEAVDAHSLLPYLSGQSDHPIRTQQTSQLHQWKMTFDGTTKHIYREDHLEETYHLPSDPYEINNLQ